MTVWACAAWPQSTASAAPVSRACLAARGRRRRELNNPSVLLRAARVCGQAPRCIAGGAADSTVFGVTEQGDAREQRHDRWRPGGGEQRNDVGLGQRASELVEEEHHETE